MHFPLPHDDCLAAFEWASAELGPAVIGGASAGANLASGVALRLRDEGRPPLGVVLLYPLVHPALPEAGPELAGKLARLTATQTFRVPSFTPMVENYLGGPVSEATSYAFAALGDLRGYPPTLVINGEYDGLRLRGSLQHRPRGRRVRGDAAARTRRPPWPRQLAVVAAGAAVLRRRRRVAHVLVCVRVMQPQGLDDKGVVVDVGQT